MAITWPGPSSLAPFVSFVVLRKPSGINLASVASSVHAVLSLGGHRFEIEDPELLTTASGHRVMRIHYVERRRPPWAKRGGVWPGPEDVRHHLVLIIAHKYFVAISCSEGTAAAGVVDAAREVTGPLASLHRVPTDRLEQAFAWGKARTLWLETVQGGSEHRADGKVLAGQDLAFALDPLEDQGYSFSSARCDHGDSKSVGVSPARARVWKGPTGNLDTFVSQCSELLGYVSTQQSAPGFRKLLARRTPSRPVDRAFELSLTSPDVDESAGNAAEPAVEAERLRLADEILLRVDSVGGAAFDVTFEPPLPPCVLRGDIVSRDRMSFSCLSGHTGVTGLCALTREVLNDGRWTTVRYGTGHTWRQGDFYEMRLRRVEFEPEFTAFDHGKYNAKEEKPRKKVKPSSPGVAPVTLNSGKLKLNPTLAWDLLWHDQASHGEMTRSLFNWIAFDRPTEVLSPGGWLTCDDGPGERADFIHLDTSTSTVSLIHVKAQHAGGNEVALGDFELVVAQAIKNLRWLEIMELPAILAARDDDVARLVWAPPGQVVTAKPRKDMAAAIEALGAMYKRRVVVVQPGLSETAWNAAAGEDSRDLLSTLLVAASVACHGLGAKFVVVGRK